MLKKSSYEIKGIGLLMLLFLSGLAGYVLFMGIHRVTGGSYGTYPCILTLGFLAGITAGLIIKRKMTEHGAVIMIFASSMALKLDYIYYTSCYMRQQDTLLFDYPMGHLGYIGYLYFNRHLPDFDPRQAWSFSHPPLHHAVSAFWVRVNTKLGISQSMAVENIQLLTLFYTGAILLFVYLILKEMNVKGWALYSILLITAFHPCFIIMSGSVNNDILSIMFMAGAFLYTLRWYKDSSLKNILILAVMIGCAMMSKVSAGIIAVGIAAVFLIKFVAERMQWKKYIARFAAFGVVVFPLGLWAPIRNNILFGVPLTYAEKLELSDPQYIGNIPLIQRFTDFSLYQLQNLNIQFEEAGTYREFNVFLGLLKTTIFGYFDFYKETPLMTAAGTALFWMNVLLVFASIAAGIVCLTKYRKKMTVTKVFFFLQFVVFMISYFNFCVQYPHICTMNVRYIMPVLFAGLFFLAIGMKEHREAYTELGRPTAAGLPERLMMVFAVVWSVLSAVMFLTLGTL